MFLGISVRSVTALCIIRSSSGLNAFSSLRCSYGRTIEQNHRELFSVSELSNLENLSENATSMLSTTVLNSASEALLSSQVPNERRNSPMASHIELAHLFWRSHVKPNDIIIDCTAGNGHDSLYLSRLLFRDFDPNGINGRLISMDIQQTAVDATRRKLEENLPSNFFQNIAIVHSSFCELPPAQIYPVVHDSISLIVYNLGYLPGGDKAICTKTNDTIESLQKATTLIKAGGAISIMCYPGHIEGNSEAVAVREWAKSLPRTWRVFVHEQLNSNMNLPFLILAFKL